MLGTQLSTEVVATHIGYIDSLLPVKETDKGQCVHRIQEISAFFQQGTSP